MNYSPLDCLLGLLVGCVRMRSRGVKAVSVFWANLGYDCILKHLAIDTMRCERKLQRTVDDCVTFTTRVCTFFIKKMFGY